MDGRGLRGRRIARGLLSLAVGYGLAVAVLWMAYPPSIMDPIFGNPGFLDLRAPIFCVGVASYFLGLGWMIRIYRAQPEPGDRGWRYHRLTWRSREV